MAQNIWLSMVGRNNYTVGMGGTLVTPRIGIRRYVYRINSGLNFSGTILSWFYSVSRNSFEVRRLVIAIRSPKDKSLVLSKPNQRRSKHPNRTVNPHTESQ